MCPTFPGSASFSFPVCPLCHHFGFECVGGDRRTRQEEDIKPLLQSASVTPSLKSSVPHTSASTPVKIPAQGETVAHFSSASVFF